MSAERMSAEDAYKEAKVVSFVARESADIKKITKPSKEDYDRASRMIDELRIEDPEKTKKQIDAFDETDYEITKDLGKEKAEIIPEMKELIKEAVILIKRALSQVYPDIAEGIDPSLFAIIDGEELIKKDLEGIPQELSDISQLLSDKFGIVWEQSPGNFNVNADAITYPEEQKIYLVYADIRKSILEFRAQLSDPRYLESYKPEQIRSFKIEDISNMLSHEYLHLQTMPQQIEGAERADLFAHFVYSKSISSMAEGLAQHSGVDAATIRREIESYLDERLFDKDGHLKQNYQIVIEGCRIIIQDKKGDNLMETGYELNEEINELLNEKIIREVAKIDRADDKINTERLILAMRENRRRDTGQVRGKSTKDSDKIINPEEAETLLTRISLNEGIDYSVNGDNLLKAYISGRLVEILIKYSLEEYLR